MKCINCNSEMPGEGYCPMCGTLNRINYAQLQNEVLQNTAQNGYNQQMIMPPVKNKKPLNKKALLAIVCSLIVIIAVIVTVVILSNRPKTINLNDYLQISIEGKYNGYATAKYTFDYNGFVRDNEDIKLSNNNTRNTGSGKVVDKFLTDLGVYTDKLGSFDKGDRLTNGDKVEFNWSINKSKLEENYKVSLGYEPIEITVDGLDAAETFNPFDEDYISIIYTGVEPDGKAAIEVKNDNPYKNAISYSLDKNNGLSDGDTIILSISGNENENDVLNTCIETFGKVPETLSKEYKVEISRYIKDETEIPQADIEAIDNQTQDYMKAYVARKWGEGESLIGLKPIGNYFLTSKSEKKSTRNILYRLYLMMLG